jgi:phosphoglycerol transferase MdoB-like AlkP superfamily enzyme
MENHMVFDDKTKTRMGVIFFIPIISFLICLAYYIILLTPLAGGTYEPGSVVGITRHNYDTMFIMLAAASLITAPIFIYCLVLLTRFKHMNAAEKLLWIVFLSVMAPLASVLFWVFHIKNMPKYVPTYPDIA